MYCIHWGGGLRFLLTHLFFVVFLGKILRKSENKQKKQCVRASVVNRGQHDQNCFLVKYQHTGAELLRVVELCWFWDASSSGNVDRKCCKMVRAVYLRPQSLETDKWPFSRCSPCSSLPLFLWLTLVLCSAFTSTRFSKSIQMWFKKNKFCLTFRNRFSSIRFKTVLKSPKMSAVSQMFCGVFHTVPVILTLRSSRSHFNQGWSSTQ